MLRRSTPAIHLAVFMLVALPVSRAMEKAPNVRELFGGDLGSVQVAPVANGLIVSLAIRGDSAYVLAQRPPPASDVILKVSRKTGKTEAVWPIAGNGAAAICFDGDALWVLSRSRSRFLRKLSTTGDVVRTIRLRSGVRGTLHGLAVVGDAVFFSLNAGGKSAVYKYLPLFSKSEKLFSVDERVYSLVVRDKKLYAYQRRFDTYAEHWLYVFDLGTRKLKKLRFLNTTARGLATDGRTMYVLGRRGNGGVISPVAVLEKEKTIVGKPVGRRVSLAFPFTSANQSPYTLDLWIPYPMDRAFQSVANIAIVPKPRGVTADKFGNRWAHVHWNTVTGDRKAILTFDLVTACAAYTLDKAYVFKAADVPERILSSCTSETYCFDYSHPVPKAAVRKITGSPTLVSHVLAVRDYVNDALEVKGPSGWGQKASVYLSGGEGRCYGHTLVFAALARGRGIPTTAVGGISLAGKDPEGKPTRAASAHTWNRVYMPGTGWVDVDSQLDDGKKGRHGYGYVGFRSNEYFVTFVGDYDRTDYKDVFAQRCWYRQGRWFCDRARMADVRSGPVEITTQPLTDRPAKEPPKRPPAARAGRPEPSAAGPRR